MDIAHVFTDKRIADISSKLTDLYNDAYKQAFAKVEKRLGEISIITDAKERKAQYYLLEREQSIVNRLAKDINNVNQHAVSIINGERLNVFAENRNFTGWNIETQAGLNIDWTIYNRDAVARLLVDNPELLPPTKIDIPKDLKWNADKIRSVITGGIIQGSTIPQIAKKFKNISDMNKRSSERNARTALGAAQSAGRIDAMRYAERKGVEMVKKWSSTFDNRTRFDHRQEDGVEVGIEEKFPTVGLMFPCDPNGPASQVYNCRCAVVSKVKNVDRVAIKRDNITGEMVKDMNYKQWYASRSKEVVAKEKADLLYKSREDRAKSTKKQAVADERIAKQAKILAKKQPTAENIRLANETAEKAKASAKVANNAQRIYDKAKKDRQKENK